MPNSKPRKKKHTRPATKAGRSGNPAVRRAEEDAARAKDLARSGWPWDAEPFTGFAEQEFDQEAMDRAKADAEPVIAELAAADMPVAWLEDELCLRLGRALATQGAQEAKRGADRNLGYFDQDMYGPYQLIDAFSEIIASEAMRAVSGVDDPDGRQRRWRLLLAVARIVPYPDARIPIGAVENLRESVMQFPEASMVTAAGPALWCRDVYGTRFGITAPFSAPEGPDRWYLWDIDTCNGAPHTVGAGYFPTSAQAFAAWQEVVGTGAAAQSRLEPLSDADLADRILPVAGERHLGGESESQYAEFHRCRRLAQELRAAEHQGDGTISTDLAQPEPDSVADSWITEFTSWRAKHRPGHKAVPDDFPHDGEPLTDDEVYRELAFIWLSDELPHLAYACSPHRIALVARSIDDLYDTDTAAVLRRLLPDLVTWLTERTALPPEARDRARACAERAVRPEAELGEHGTDLPARIRE